MKLKTILLSIVLLTIIGCKQYENKIENTSDSTTDIVQSVKVPDHHADWVNSINKNINVFEDSYNPNAIKIISPDSILNSSTQIVNYYKAHKSKITSIESLFSIEANKDRGIHYELFKYKTDNHKEYVQLVIWSMENKNVTREMENKNVTREFEFTQENTSASASVDTTDIAKRRELWMTLCNSHEVENLVKQLYTSNTMYYNHKPIVQGTEGLIKEYGYMNTKNYSLNLSPLTLEVINANYAFEIGQCSGSYNGNYILIWEKQADGNWKILIDSNI